MTEAWMLWTSHNGKLWPSVLWESPTLNESDRRSKVCTPFPIAPADHGLPLDLAEARSRAEKM